MVQRLSLPLRVTRGLATVTQDSPAEVAQSVALLVATRPGERRSVPDYGMPDPLFDGLDPDELVAAVQEWEERADPATVELVTTGVLEHGVVRPALPDVDESTDEEVV